MIFKVLLDPIGMKNNTFIDVISNSPNIRVYPSFISGLKDHARIAHINWLEYDTWKKFIRFFIKILIYKLLGIKILFTVHNVVEHIHDRYYLTYLQYKIIIKVSNQFMFFSNNDRRVFERFYKVNIESKSHIINHCPVRFKIERKSKIQAREKLNLDLNKIIVLYYGPIFRYKGVDDLIDFVSQLKIVKDKKIFLIIIGKCREPNLEEIILAKLSHLEEYCWIKDYLPEEVLSDYIIAADINAMTFKEISNSGTFCLGKRYPTKIFAPYTGSLPEHDYYGFPSYFYRKRDFESMKKIFLKAIEDPPYPNEFISDEVVVKEEQRMIYSILKIYHKMLFG